MWLFTADSDTYSLDSRLSRSPPHYYTQPDNISLTSQQSQQSQQQQQHFPSNQATQSRVPSNQQPRRAQRQRRHDRNSERGLFGGDSTSATESAREDDFDDLDTAGHAPG